MKFIADMMLGRLARWLRLYGYDTLYGIVEDEEIIRRALEEDRIILTRDSGLAESARGMGAKVFLLSCNSLEGQVEELKTLGVEFKELFPANARCPKCNGLIVRVPKEEVKGKDEVGRLETLLPSHSSRDGLLNRRGQEGCSDTPGSAP
ncbi:MAG: uncharacterized protein PWQ95_1624 [Thermococcaceae archaeon]|nr:uncharacterized protein [Thermococcaceae archaeon]